MNAFTVLTGWNLTSFGGCLKCGPKFTDTFKKKKKTHKQIFDYIASVTT